MIPKNDRALSPASQTPCAAKDSTPADSFHWDVLQQFPQHTSLELSGFLYPNNWQTPNVPRPTESQRIP